LVWGRVKKRKRKTEKRGSPRGKKSKERRWSLKGRMSVQNKVSEGPNLRGGTNTR